MSPANLGESLALSVVTALALVEVFSKFIDWARFGLVGGYHD